MSATWENRAPLELAWTRKARVIVEAIDPVTLYPVSGGLTLKVKGFDSNPIVSSSGRFVWFEERGKTPLEIEVDPGRLPYLPPLVLAVPPLPVPPDPPRSWSFVTLELGPSPAYPFVPGITGLRGTVIRNVADDPPVRLDDVEVRLQWIDDAVLADQWVNAPTVSRTSTKGDFAIVVRLAPNQIARTDAQNRMRVRVAASRAGNTRFSSELQIPFDRVSDAQQSFAWDDLQP